MFCSNCGVENLDGAKFCKQCGTPLVEIEDKIAKEHKDNGGEVYTNVSMPKLSQQPKKPLSQKTIMGIACAALVVIAIVAIWVYSSTTINLNKYVVVDTEGYNGYGKANVYIDWDAISEEYDKKVKFTSAANRKYGASALFMSPSEVLSDYVNIDIIYSDTGTNGLSNGDTINYEWIINEDYSKYLKCRIKYKDDSLSVSDLTELGTFDAFDGLKVEFSGISPNGTANLNYTGDRFDYNVFSYDNYNELENGDVVTVRIADYVVEQCAENYGEIPESLVKEYMVEGLSSYVSSISQIDDETLLAMMTQAEDVYNAYVANDWVDSAELYGFSYMGDYLLTKKSNDVYGATNRLILVYNIKAHNYYSNGGKTYDSVNETYWYIAYEDLLVSPDGNAEVEIMNYYTPNARYTFDSGISYGWYGTRSWYYYGYGTLKDLYSDAVLSNVDNYNHEDNIAGSSEESNLEQNDSSSADGDYVLEKSSTELIYRSDLEGLTAEQCKIARNEIYARHGRKFDDADLQAYFDACDWYKGTVEPNDFKESELSEIEIANRDVIVAYEVEKGYR